MKNRNLSFVIVSAVFFVAFIIHLLTINIKGEAPVPANNFVSIKGVCPPFHLLTENGDTINPVTGKNIDKPYSPRQTCGRCHDYDKITQGYHFQQGKGEPADSLQASRAQWVSHPGNYGGNWCSPAPLYAYLSAKENTNEKLLDLTSYTFVNKCGVCHPGGGSLEYDRNGMRYDKVMADTAHHFKDGAKNKLDGDYYKAQWLASGVIEADCYICHLPQYNNKERVNQIKKLNYRYAALAASGFGKVAGSVADAVPVSVSYNKELFNPDGTVEPNIVKEPTNTACLYCHAKPGYKKRGANFRDRTDVHLNAGLKCVDCHPAGSMATDSRINGREQHQFAKGDDPGGVVRNDLNNTMRTCADCHDNGYMGAPMAKHAWLPDLHLDKIACQTCHVPERYVKSAHYVASDVFNPGTKIPTKGKHLWTFYGPDMKYWNHYGDLEMMGYDHKPTFAFKPELGKYKGMIYPVNRIHSSWPGILIEGKEGLMQPKMSDVYKMWTSFQKDSTKYPLLAKIADNTDDKVIEVNRPEEIDALIASVSGMLKDIDYPMEGKQVVWVMNNRVYKSGDDFYEIPMREWEASPYGNVHKYNHDILPANAAMGSKSCTECHASTSDMFFAQVLKNPVGTNGQPEYEAQYKHLGLSGFMVWSSVVREEFIKAFEYPALLFLLIIMALYFAIRLNDKRRYVFITAPYLTLFYLLLSVGFALVYLKPDLHSYILPDTLWFDKNHFIIGLVSLLIGFYSVLKMRNARKTHLTVYKAQIGFIALAVLTGFFMMIKFDAIFNLVRYAYTLFDIAVVGSIIASALFFLQQQFECLKIEAGLENSTKNDE